MDPVLPSRESPDEAFLLQLSTLARNYAREYMTREAAADLAQDLVLEHLIKLRAGICFDDIASVDAYVRDIVRKRLVDGLRRKKLHERRDPEYAREVLDGPRAWMSPDLALEERELEVLHKETLASLPYDCRRAFTLVREVKTTYETAATFLGVTRGAVNRHVIFAQHHFRRELREYGIVTPTPKRRTRTAQRSAR